MLYTLVNSKIFKTSVLFVMLAENYTRRWVGDIEIQWICSYNIDYFQSTIFSVHRMTSDVLY